MKVFVHIDAFGTYVGNGGFLTACHFANRLAQMGYDVSVFDSRNRLKWKMFDWLSLDETRFSIASSTAILMENTEDCRVVSSWLQALPMHLRNESLRIWDRSELLRINKEKERKFVHENFDRIAVAHKHLLPYYNDIGIHNPIVLETWIESKACYGMSKIRNTVGIQLERTNTRMSRFLSRLVKPSYDFGRYRGLKGYKTVKCNGTYGNVLRNMKRADFFVHNPRPSPHLGIFKGETFGLPLFDAMACGCVCLAVNHKGINFLNNVVPLRDNMADICLDLDYLMRDVIAKEMLRHRSVKFIEENYRFDEARRTAIKQLLQ